MALPIFFIDQPTAGAFITLNEETSKHIIQVLRMHRGEPLQLADGKGNLLTANIEDDHKKKCIVKVIERLFSPKKEKQVSIGISLLKNASRFEWFLEKAAEIGVTEIIPLLCDRTEKHHFRFDRMNNILLAAMLQSQQSYLPILHEPVEVQQVINSSMCSTKLIAHCEEEKKQSIKDFSTKMDLQILIGPEGDFTLAEIEMALSKDYMPVTLGETRLRTETAGVVAAALLCV